MLKLIVDAEAIAAQFKEFAKEVQADMQKAMENLATLTRAQIAEEVKNGDDKLKSTQSLYMDNLSDATEVSPGVWAITLDEKALWIEEGMKPHDMKPDLLDGKPYRVIPFKYNTVPTQTTPDTQLLISAIQKKLSKEKIPYRDLELNEDGTPKTGKLHDLKWGVDLRGKKGSSIGAEKRPGKGNTPRLQGLSIYQTPTASGNVRRDILTFRTVSAGPASKGKWMHPGSDAKKYMDKAMDEAVKQWEEKILPGILAKWEGR